MTTTARAPRIATVHGDREVRTFHTKLTARDDGGLQYVVEGYASVTESPYPMGAYTETIKRGAFLKTLAQRPDVMLLANHEGLPYARTTLPPGQPGSLTLSEDSKGLHFRAQLDRSDPDVREIMHKIGSGLLDQCSFAFRVVEGGQSWNDYYTQRDITEVSLDRGDVSIVNYGASADTSVDARSRTRGRGGNLPTYQARALALRLQGTARTRYLWLANEAGRRPSGPYQARAGALRLRGRQGRR